MFGAASKLSERLRQYYPAGETDGDTTDDTHICRVLHAYYKEKGCETPTWLPPDPSAPPAARLQQYGQTGGNKMSSLFDDNRSQQTAPPPQQPQSLRQHGARVAGISRREQPGSSDGAYAPRPLPSQLGGSYQSALAPSQPMLSAADRLKLKGKTFAGRSGSTSPSLGSQSGGNLRPPGENQRQASYESGRADYLERGGQRGYR